MCGQQKNVPQDVHILLSGACEQVRLCGGETEGADGTEVTDQMTFRWGGDLGLSRWAYVFMRLQ